jgi:prevent-host-death family protein
MHSVSVSEPKKRFTVLLEGVEGGGEVIITRRGKPIARLAPLETGFNGAMASAATDGLRELSKGCTLGGLTIRDLTSEGHGAA